MRTNRRATDETIADSHRPYRHSLEYQLEVLKAAFHDTRNARMTRSELASLLNTVAYKITVTNDTGPQLFTTAGN